jgi:hypothetical protein
MKKKNIEIYLIIIKKKILSILYLNKNFKFKKNFFLKINGILNNLIFNIKNLSKF